MTNSETTTAPINVSRGEHLFVAGEIEKWDIPFAESASGRPGERPSDAHMREGRMPLLFVAFRRQGWLRNFTAGSYRYEGVSGLEVGESGETLRFDHQVRSPVEPGTYRAQIHVLERNPVLLAQMDPREASKPLGVLAEAIVVVE